MRSSTGFFTGSSHSKLELFRNYTQHISVGSSKYGKVPPVEREDLVDSITVSQTVFSPAWPEVNQAYIARTMNPIRFTGMLQIWEEPAQPCRQLVCTSITLINCPGIQRQNVLLC